MSVGSFQVLCTDCFNNFLNSLLCKKNVAGMIARLAMIFNASYGEFACRKREEFMRDVRAKKENFVPGLWNVNVVRLGGLGKLPDKMGEQALYLGCSVNIC